MQGVVLRLAITAVSILVASYLGFLSFVDLGSIVMFVIVLGVLNALLRPLLLLFTLPLNLLTLGLFTLVINGFVFWAAAQVPVGVQVPGFIDAFLAALVVSAVSFVLSKAVP